MRIACLITNNHMDDQKILCQHCGTEKVFHNGGVLNGKGYRAFFYCPACEIVQKYMPIALGDKCPVCGEPAILGKYGAYCKNCYIKNKTNN